ncbi:MAG: beta-glucosidase BglX [Clostridiaceae bacterium]
MENIKLKELLKSLTIEEKIGQLFQVIPFLFNDSNKGEVTGPMKDLGIGKKEVDLAGSVLGVSGAKEMKEIQSKYLENSSTKIPLIFMADIIHGCKTIFPIPLALGCSWDMEAVETVARVSAREASAAGIHVTFSPMVDLVRDPRWGRVMESTGEDTYLNSLFARAFVRGYQGDLGEENIAACVKHFAAYGAPEGGRDYNTVDMSERQLREYYLPAYRAAIEEGAKMIMTSFNTVDGVPSTGNKWLMRKVLREEWGFEGVAISDWGSLGELIEHGVSENGKEAAKLAIEAGTDMEMMTSHYVNYLKELIEEGSVSMELLDESVYRILDLKNQLGLFENPYRGASEEKEAEVMVCKEHRDAARRVAEKSMVLLKNEGILPLKKSLKKIALIGPFSDEKGILGGWSWQGRYEETISLKEGIANIIGEDKILIARGCSNDIPERAEEALNKEGFEEALKAAKEAEVIVLALGEDRDLSAEGGCRTNIKLPGVQEELAREIIALNKPTVLVLFNGRPLDITELSQEAGAILEAWYPGTEGGNAVARVLFGEVNPQGRLSMSFPFNVGQIPVYYNAYSTGRPKHSEYGDKYKYESNRYNTHYLDAPNAPAYPFGYGLSYTEYEYGELALSSEVIAPGEKLKVSLKVKNTGNMAGIETVQLYIQDKKGSVVRPVKELKSFKKVELEAGEEKEVVFDIDEDMLKFHNLDKSFKAEKGVFSIMVGPNSQEVSTKEFKLI